MNNNPLKYVICQTEMDNYHSPGRGGDRGIETKIDMANIRNESWSYATFDFRTPTFASLFQNQGFGRERQLLEFGRVVVKDGLRAINERRKNI